MNQYPSVQIIADRFALFPPVTAVALAGSRASGGSDEHSDFDIYIYSEPVPPIEARTQIAWELGDHARPIEINNRYWGAEDAWFDGSSGTKIDLVYWSPAWIEDQIDRVLVRHEGGVGYSTCFWHTVLHSVPYFERDGWFTRLQQRAAQPYPDPLRRDVLIKNYPVLRRAIPSYRYQIAVAIQRQDRISLNNRLTGLLASYFDVLFAVNRIPNPGKKRLAQRVPLLCPILPENWEQHIEVVLCSAALPWSVLDTLRHVDTLLDHLDRVLVTEQIITPDGAIIGKESTTCP